MRKIMKKVVALAAVAAMTMTSLVGCATGSNVDNSEVVATVGDSEVTAGVANFYLRYQQSGMEALYTMYFGDDFWTQESPEGTPYGDSLKDDVMGILHEFYVLEDHLADYNVSLSEDDLALIDKAAADFVEANSESVLKNVSGELEIVKQVLTFFAINERMFEALTADVDREISDEEAAQKRLRYYSVNKMKTEDGVSVEITGDELETLKSDMGAFLEGAKANGNMKEYGEAQGISTYELTFDKDSTTISEEVIKVADTLKEGEFSDVIEADSYLYVIQLESEFDEEATEKEKEDMVAMREEDAYDEVVSVWLEETPIEVNEEAWDKINVEVLKVLTPEAE